MSEDGGEKDRKKESVIQYSNTIQEPNHLLRKLVTFSVIPEDLDTLTSFKTIAKREAGSKGFSQTVIKAMKEYNERHDEGNPQLKIASYLPTAQKSPIKVLCWSNLAGATSDGKVYCRLGGGGWIQGIACYSCRNNQLRKKDKG
jgi:hypothetical protein